MRNQCLTTLLAAALAITACSQQPAALTSSDLAALRDLFPAWEKAVGSGDYEAAAILLTEDFVISEAHRAPIVGRDSMLAWMRATWPKDMQQTWVVHEVHGQGDLALPTFTRQRQRHTHFRAVRPRKLLSALTSPAAVRAGGNSAGLVAIPSTRCRRPRRRGHDRQRFARTAGPL